MCVLEKGGNRASDEIGRRRLNWIDHIMRKDREEHWVAALEWRPKRRKNVGRPKLHGGEWLKVKCKQLDGSLGSKSN